MELSIINILAIAMLVEAVVQAIKGVVTSNKEFALWEIISMGVCVVIAVLAQINLLDGMIATTEPVVLYLLYVCSGIAIGRGPSFVHDLWGKLRA